MRCKSPDSGGLTSVNGKQDARPDREDEHVLRNHGDGVAGREAGQNAAVAVESAPGQGSHSTRAYAHLLYCPPCILRATCNSM